MATTQTPANEASPLLNEPYDADEESLSQGDTLRVPQAVGAHHHPHRYSRQVEASYASFEAEGVDRETRDRAAFVFALVGMAV